MGKHNSFYLSRVALVRRILRSKDYNFLLLLQNTKSSGIFSETAAERSGVAEFPLEFTQKYKLVLLLDVEGETWNACIDVLCYNKLIITS